MIMLLENDTKKELNMLAASNFRANVRQNKVMIISITLVTFMIFTVFSIGMSFYYNYQRMNIRLTGTTANGFAASLSAQQLTLLSRTEDISQIGTQIFAGSAQIDGQTMVLTYYDQAEWDNHIRDTIKNLQGSLPRSENEIMLSEAALKLFDIETPEEGMELTLYIVENGKSYEKTFQLSGWFQDYVSMQRSPGGISGNVAAAGLKGEQADVNAVVSQQFAEKHCLYQLTTFSSERRDTAFEAQLKEMLQLTDEQLLILTAPSTDGSGSTISALTGVATASIFIMLCGYLLIYNIAYISVTKDIHFYGMLKTLGTTQRQIKRIVRRQIMMLSALSIPVGIILGSAVSLLAVPAVLKALLTSGGLGSIMDYTASFHPGIYLLAVVFSFITVMISCRKPAREAARVSPIAAIRYTESEIRGSRRQTSSSYKTRLYDIAFRNVFRNKRRSTLVFLSLFMGLTVFLSIYTIFSGPDWDYQAVMEAPFDFTLNDATIGSMTELDEGQLNEAFLENLSLIQGIAETEIIYGTSGKLSSADMVWSSYIDDKAAHSSLTKEELAADPRANTAGITSKLLKTFPLSEGTYDTEAIHGFESGKLVYLSPTESGRIPEHLTGRTITIQNSITGQTADYTIGGILSSLSIDTWKEGENSYTNFSVLHSNGLSSDYGKRTISRIFMSKKGMEQLFPRPYISQIFINADAAAESTVRQQLISLTAGNENINLLVKSAYLETNKITLGSIMTAGTVFSFLLLLIGLINFANTMTTSVYARQKEFATLESIGMTKKQILNTLSFEGLYYAVFSILLLLLLGIPFTCGLIQLVQEQFYFLTFQPPTGAVLLIIILVTAICFIVPRRTYRQISKASVTERLRNLE